MNLRVFMSYGTSIISHTGKANITRHIIMLNALIFMDVCMARLMSHASISSSIVWAFLTKSPGGGTPGSCLYPGCVAKYL